MNKLNIVPGLKIAAIAGVASLSMAHGGVAANEKHSIRNVGDTPVTYHVIKFTTQKTLDLKAKETK